MFADLDSALPQLAQFDYTNCSHVKLWNYGLSRHGRLRFQCAFCRQRFTETAPNQWEVKRERVARALMEPGATIRQVARDLAVTIKLVMRVRKALGAKRLGSCVCGQGQGHRGWCEYRRLRKSAILP